MGLSSDSACPCGSNKKYKRCCRVYHQGTEPPTALALMKARYSAYSATNFQFIIKTTHPECSEFKSNLQSWTQEIQEFCKKTKFIKLQIIKFEDGPETAYVTFQANLIQNKTDASFTEKSTFQKINGNWFYLKGEFLNY